MRYYRAYGLTIASGFALAELPEAPAAVPAITVCAGDAIRDRSAWRWVARRVDRQDGQWLAVGVRNESYLLSFQGTIDFTVAADGTTIRCHPHESVPASTIEHLLIDQVIPLVLGHRRRLVLHASACLVGGRAVAFLGGTGAGKSSLAAAFSAAGAAILSDDAVAVDEEQGRPFAAPSYPGIRLWFGADEDHAAGEAVAHYTSKRRLRDGVGLRFASTSAPLARVYAIGGAAAIEIAPLSARDAVLAIVGHTFVLDVDDRTAIAEHFDRAVSLCRRVPVQRLGYPRRPELLAQVYDAVVADLASQSR